MTLISPDEATQALAQLEGLHHPHFKGTTTGRYGNVHFDLAPFTGHEPEPTIPTEIYRNKNLGHTAYAFLEAEYEQARTMWHNARYINALTDATAGAPALWDTYATARRDMDRIYAALATTPDTHWRATVFKLIAAQEKTLAAAQAWDRKGADIARAHAVRHDGDLGRSEAYKRIGVDADAWIVGSEDDYVGWGETPLYGRIRRAVDAQGEQLQKVANLTGDRT
jgi:hypothetical protein